MMTGAKHDQGKPMLGLVPPLTATRIATVMTECITRENDPYLVNSWRNVIPLTRWMDALERHLEAIKNGDVIDPLSRLPHIDHVLTNSSILAHQRTMEPLHAMTYPLHIIKVSG